jgi:NADH-quinone oxidoreductase subunit G
MSDVTSTKADEPAEAPPVDGVPVTLDGQAIVARKGELIIEAAERNGVYIPRFCYHPRMESVGMCRMCIVEVDTGRGPSLQPSCMLECTPDMKVDTTSPVTQKAQDGVLEFLLINHPLDCPVCDKGGECPLQDQTMAYGPGESRFVEEKRHKEKPIPVSDLVLLDRERCILCDRCTRFAKDVAGDPLIHFINRGNETEVNTFPDEPFSSYFSGNTVQICPVGALTATSYRFRARPWDLDGVESTCQGCSVGCRISVESSRNQVLRYQGVDIDPVNWGWLCDKGRFGFEAQRSPDRLSEPLVRAADAHATTRWSTALDRVAAALRATQPDRVAVVGGARLTNEAAYAWAKLAKGVIGTDHVDAQLGDGLAAEVALGLPQATIDEVCAAGGTVVLLGPDPKEELPVLFLRLRDAVVSHGVKVVEISPRAGGFTPYATVSLHPRPGEVGVAVRALLDGPPAGTDAAGVDPTDLVTASELVAAGPVHVIIGRQSVAESDQAVIDAAGALVARKPDTRFLVALRRGNVRGALDMGLAPGLMPGRVALEESRDWYRAHWPSMPRDRGLDCTGILSAAADGEIDVLVLLGADPLSDFPDRDLATRALAGARLVVAVDQFATASVQTADVILPAAGFAEVEGTTTNLEGRVSAVHAKVTAPGTARPDWIIAAELAAALGADLGLESIDAIRSEIATVAPAYAGLTPELIDAVASADGLVVPLLGESTEPGEPTGASPASVAEGRDQAANETEADETAVEVVASGPTPPALLVFTPGPSADPPPLDRYSLRLVATRKLYDQGVAVQHSPSLAGLAPGSLLAVNPYDFDRLGVSKGDQVRLHSSRADLRAEIVADADLPRGAAAVMFNQSDLDAGALIDATARVTDVRVETAGGES